MKVDPEHFLEQLCKDAHPRTEVSLRLIYALCQQQEACGSRDFSVAMIGKLSTGHGGPSAAAIRNTTGEKYRALIAAYADSIGGKKKKIASPRRTAIDDILEGVADPVLRARVSLLVADLEACRAQLLAARHLASQNAVLVFPGDTLNSQDPIVVPPIDELTAQERKSLAASISDKTLEHWGWKVDSNGRISTERGQVVFGAGFVTAIKKIVD